MSLNITTFFSKFNHYVQNFGIDIVVGKLKELDETEIESRDKKIELFIISACCSEYSVEKSELKKNTRIGSDAMVARNMCFVLLKKHLKNNTNVVVAKALGKDTCYPVRTAVKEFMNMNAKIKHEKIFLDTYNALNDRVKTFKNQVELLNN